MSSSRRRPERRLSIAQGRDAREIQLPPSAGKCFLLTSPFIERMRQIILRRPVSVPKILTPYIPEILSRPASAGKVRNFPLLRLVVASGAEGGGCWGC